MGNNKEIKAYSTRRLIRDNQGYYDKINSYYKRVNVFLSSTFKDMGEERDYILGRLAKRVKKWGDNHCLDIVFIDMRWGITKEESTDGRTIPLCLKAVEDSVPFVISLVGERRGTVTDRGAIKGSLKVLLDNPGIIDEKNYSKEMRDSLDLLRNKLGVDSITELEVQKALLGKYKDNITFLIKRDIENAENNRLREVAINNGGVDYYKDGEEFKVGDQTLEEYLFETIIRKCNGMFPDRTTYDVFHKNCQMYGRYIYHYVPYGNELQLLTNGMSKKNKYVGIKINGYGKRNLAAYLISILIDQFYVDVIFSFDELTMTDIVEQGRLMGRDLSHFLDTDIDPLGKEKPIVLVGRRISPEIIKKYENSNSVFSIVFDEKDDYGEKIQDIIVPDINRKSIREYLEKRIRMYGKRLTNEAYEVLSYTETLISIKEINEFIDELLREKDYKKINALIEKKTGEEIADKFEELEDTTSYSSEDITKLHSLVSRGLKLLHDKENQLEARTIFEEAYIISKQVEKKHRYKFVKRNALDAETAKISTIVNSYRFLISLQIYLDSMIRNINLDKEELIEAEEKNNILFKDLDNIIFSFPSDEFLFADSFLEKSVFIYRIDRREDELKDYSVLDKYKSMNYSDRKEEFDKIGFVGYKYITYALNYAYFADVKKKYKLNGEVNTEYSNLKAEVRFCYESKIPINTRRVLSFTVTNLSNNRAELVTVY